jgi:hypothetical protein
MVRTVSVRAVAMVLVPRDVRAGRGAVAALLREGPGVQAVATMVDYRHTVGRVLVPVFGAMMLEEWRASLTTAARTRSKQLTILNGIPPAGPEAVRAAAEPRD